MLCPQYGHTLLLNPGSIINLANLDNKHIPNLKIIKKNKNPVGKLLYFNATHNNISHYYKPEPALSSSLKGMGVNSYIKLWKDIYGENRAYKIQYSL